MKKKEGYNFYNFFFIKLRHDKNNNIKNFNSNLQLFNNLYTKILLRLNLALKNFFFFSVHTVLLLTN